MTSAMVYLHERTIIHRTYCTKLHNARVVLNALACFELDASFATSVIACKIDVDGVDQ